MFQFHDRWSVFITSTILDFMHLVYTLLDMAPSDDFFSLLEVFDCWPVAPIFWWCVNDVASLSSVHFVNPKSCIRLIEKKLMTASIKLKFDVAFATCAFFTKLACQCNATHNNRTHDLPASSNTSSIGSCAFLYSSSVIPCHIISLTVSGSNCILAALTGLVYIFQKITALVARSN